jgi:phosphotriesterase-related protein
VWLGFDGPSVANHATDWRLFETLTMLTADGHAGQLLLGADTTTASARGNPGMAFLMGTLRSRLVAELGEAVADQVFRVNPARAFAADWRQPGSGADQA